MLKTNLKISKLRKSLLCGLVGALPLVGAQAQTTNYATDFGATNPATSAKVYTTGNLAGQNGWAAISGAGTAPIQVNSTTGLVTVAAVAGEDDNVAFATAANGTGMMGTVTAALGNLNVTAVGTGGSYFFALSQGLGQTGYTGRLFAKSTTGGYLLGIIPSSAGTVAYGTTVLTLNTPINLTINYGFNAGTNDDTLSISVGGTVYATYGTAFDFGVGATTGGSATLGSALLRQDAANTTASTLGTITVTSNLTPVPAPEPGTFAMLGLGALGAVIVIRRRAVRA